MPRLVRQIGGGGGGGNGCELSAQHCQGEGGNKLISPGLREWEQVSFLKVRKTKIHLNAFFRQPVVSPYPTGIGLDFLGVARLPAQAVEMYSRMGQLCM